jgi:hypothetical protein
MTNHAGDDPVLEPVDHFEGAREASSPRDRLAEVKRRAASFREEMLDAEPVPYYRSFGLRRVPYPVRYAFAGAVRTVTPYIHILNRLTVVRLPTSEGPKTLLISPSDVDRNRETPFFKRLAEQIRFLGEPGERLLSPVLGTVEASLQTIGMDPACVDYISYDHLHTQDIRRWLGTNGQPGLFPNARLLVQRQEWVSAHGLLPSQADWYCPGGLEGVSADRIVLLDGDVKLGDGVAIVRTPGHTEGNHSFVVRTEEGLMVTSENGVGPDSYAPLRSSLPGLRKYAQRTGVEVILNSNTLESSVDQYISMVMEREIAGRSVRNPDFYNVVPSSEFAGYWAFPGLKPSFSFGDLLFGSLDSSA